MKKIQFLFIAAFGAFFACTSGQHTGTAPALVQVSAFDTVLDGSDVSLYTLRNDSGMVVQVTNYGARVVSLWVPDAKGDFQDVVWGYESIHDYLDSPDRFCGCFRLYLTVVAIGQCPHPIYS